MRRHADNCVVKKFRKEFEDHLNGKPCPFAKHVELAVV